MLHLVKPITNELCHRISVGTDKSHKVTFTEYWNFTFVNDEGFLVFVALGGKTI